MSDQTWIRSENFIDSSTIESITLAKEIYNSFTAQLLSGIADADILEYYNFFLTYNTDYDAKYLLWNSLGSSSPGNTLGVKQLVVKLRGTEIRRWDVIIQGFYPRKTVMYKHLLPHCRMDFQNGAIDLRVEAIVNLIDAIGDDTNLASLKIDIQAYLDLLTAAMDKQSSHFTSINKASVNLEIARMDAAEAMIYVYGKFVSKYYKNLKLMEPYFPVNLLQRLVQYLFVTTLKNNKVRFLFKRKFDIEKDTLQVKLVGKNTVIGYFTNGLTDILPAGDPFLVFTANEQQLYDPLLMGYTDEKRYFYIVKRGVGTSVATVKLN